MTAYVAQVLADALSLGGLYALTALGIGLVFGVMRLVNFAHGDLVTLAGYTVLVLAGLSVGGAIVAAIGVGVALALIIERVAMRPLRNSDPATLLVSSFAVSVFIQKTLILFVDARPKGVDLLPSLQRQVTVLGAHVPELQLVTIGTSAVLLAALTWFLRATRFGIEMRAAAENFRMARLLGVRANRVIALAFAISGFLAAVVAVLFVAQTGLVQPRMAINLINIAFVSTVVGGLGSLPGAALGGFLVGGASVLLQTFLPPDVRVFREAFVFAAVILVLLVRPQGLLSRHNRLERV